MCLKAHLDVRDERSVHRGSLWAFDLIINTCFIFHSQKDVLFYPHINMINDDIDMIDAVHQFINRAV